MNTCMNTCMHTLYAHVLFKTGGCGYYGEVAHETKVDDWDRLGEDRADGG